MIVFVMIENHTVCFMKVLFENSVTCVVTHKVVVLWHTVVCARHAGAIVRGCIRSQARAQCAVDQVNTQPDTSCRA